MTLKTCTATGVKRESILSLKRRYLKDSSLLVVCFSFVSGLVPARHVVSTHAGRRVMSADLVAISFTTTTLGSLLMHLASDKMIYLLENSDL